MDKTVKPVRQSAVPHNDNPDAAHAGTALVRRLEIYRRKIFHPNPFTVNGNDKCTDFGNRECSDFGNSNAPISVTMIHNFR